MMMLKLKGLIRRMGAGCASLSEASRQAMIGIGVLAFIILAWSCIRAYGMSSFDLVAAEDSAKNAEMGASVYADVVPSEDVPESPADASVVVHVGGCVMHPGVYEVPEGSRVSSCIEAAGGFTDEANTDGLNLARKAVDGEHIVVPAQGEVSRGTVTVLSGGSLVSINTATVEELCRLDGIGEVLAARIVTYRSKHGGFATLEQLKQVSGIGDARYEAIKDDICL